MSRNNGDKDFYSIVFLMVATAIVILGVLILLTNTNSGDKIGWPSKGTVIVTCEYETHTNFNIRAEDAFRDNEVVRVKQPRSVFVIHDPNRKCVILE